MTEKLCVNCANHESAMTKLGSTHICRRDDFFTGVDPVTGQKIYRTVSCHQQRAEYSKYKIVRLFFEPEQSMCGPEGKYFELGNISNRTPPRFT